jgi:hypothetical protein
MKSILSMLILVSLINCSPNFNKDFSVYRNEIDYKMWITYNSTKKDTIAINWLLSYQITNKTNKGVKYDWIRKRPEYLMQNALMKTTDSLSIFNRLIYKNKKFTPLFSRTSFVKILSFRRSLTKLYRLCIQYSPIKIELFEYYNGIIPERLD